MRRRASVVRLLIAAGLVLVSDLVSKQWALLHLPGRTVLLLPGVHLGIVHNHGLAWGMQAGGFGLQITALLTVALVALVAQVAEPLMAIDGAAPVALGLLTGAGAANLLDALVAPAGVVDFIAIARPGGATSVLNVADLLAAVGFVLLARTVWCLVRAMRESGSWSVALPRKYVRQLDLVLPATTPTGRPRTIVSLGYAFAAMCGFIWLYSIVIVWTPNAGQSAPSTLLCAAAVFAASFVAAQSWSWFALRRQSAAARRRIPLLPWQPTPPPAGTRTPRLEVVVDRRPMREPGRVPLAAADRDRAAASDRRAAAAKEASAE